VTPVPPVELSRMLSWDGAACVFIVFVSVRLFFSADSAAYRQAYISRRRDDSAWLERYASGARIGAVLMVVGAVIQIVRILMGA